MPSIKQRRRAKRRAEKLVEEAVEAAASDQIHLAEKLVQRALDAGPANARFWLEYARISAQHGRSRRAERAARRALELSPSYAEARDFLDATMPPVIAPPPAPIVPGDEPTEVCFTERTERFDWSELRDELTARGVARVPGLVAAEECVALRELFGCDERFEHEVRLDDERGRLAYRFFTRPLPDLVVELRREVYARIAPIANGWNELLGDPRRWPATHEAFQRSCHDGGHRRTSPILLRYEPGGFNGFHRDVHGALFFPLQLAVSLGPATLGDGGEFVFVDDRPGKRKRIRAIETAIGDAVIFCTRDRLCPIAGLYGRQPVMHGARETRVERHVLGAPFHDYAG